MIAPALWERDAEEAYLPSGYDGDESSPEA